MHRFRDKIRPENNEKTVTLLYRYLEFLLPLQPCVPVFHRVS